MVARLSLARTSVARLAIGSVLVLLATTASGQADDRIRVLVFQGEGVGKSVHALIEALEKSDADSFEIRRVSPEEIQRGTLQQADVLIQPGGSGSRQGKALGEQGRQAVRDFVNRGGGYMGVCAGSYLATNDYDWSLNLIDAKVVDRRHWARGNGTVQLRLSPQATAFFGYPSEQLEIHYGQGPLLSRREWDDEGVPDYQSLAIYRTGIAKNGAPEGIMPGTSAIVRARYGDGRVFCFSPHPELTAGREQMVATAVHWLAGTADTP